MLKFSVPYKRNAIEQYQLLRKHCSAFCRINEIFSLYVPMGHSWSTMEVWSSVLNMVLS